jgi:phage/plasmid-like protein (TIGR03299 family)
MAHDLLAGRMAYVGEEAPWHHLGKAVPATVTSAELCQAAGLNWKVWKDPAPGARLVNKKKNVHDRYLILRQPIEAEKDPVALGMVGAGYEPLQNIDAFKFFEPFIDTEFAEFHTAGGLGNGERVWVLAKLKHQIVVGKDDPIDRYLLLANTHNGEGAVSVRFTPIRVVCQNTLNLALKEKGKSAITVRHTRHMDRHLVRAQADELKQIIDKVFADAANSFAAMACRTLRADERDEILEALFPRTKLQRDKHERPERWRRVEEILENPAVTPRSTAASLWGLYNAVVRDEDYRSSREAGPESRLERVWFGSGEDLKLRTLGYCRDFLKMAA